MRSTNGLCVTGEKGPINFHSDYTQASIKFIRLFTSILFNAARLRTCKAKTGAPPFKVNACLLSIQCFLRNLGNGDFYFLLGRNLLG